MTKPETRLANIMELAKMAGIELEVTEDILKQEREVEAHREADAVAFFFRNPEEFRHGTCLYCRNLFLVNRRFVAFCSMEHRVMHFQETTGMKWDVSRPASERWSLLGGEPLCISPEALAVLIELAQERISDLVPSP